MYEANDASFFPVAGSINSRWLPAAVGRLTNKRHRSVPSRYALRGLARSLGFSNRRVCNALGLNHHPTPHHAASPSTRAMSTRRNVRRRGL